MPVITLPLAANGEPRLEVMVGVTAAQAARLLAAQLPVPPSVTVLGEIDTGASITGVDLPLLAQFGLQAAGTTTLFTPVTGSATPSFPVFHVGLTLLHPNTNFYLPNLLVVGTHLAAQGIRVLIGRDVLAYCLYYHNGPAKHFTLAF
jgi:hypothetical protein